jgi:hypothetical protein
MKVRHNHIHFRRGQQTFAVRRATNLDAILFVGSINGIECGAWPTKEAAVNALLRRAASALNY